MSDVIRVALSSRGAEVTFDCWPESGLPRVTLTQGIDGVDLIEHEARALCALLIVQGYGPRP